MIVTRFAPSPTGNLHIWWVRTAFYSRLWARKNNWKYILRIEDTDTTRSTKFFEQDIIKSFEWLWLEWDAWPWNEDGKWPYYQMQRLEIYQKYIDQLLVDWKAYYAWESSQELDQMREECSKRKLPFVYRKIDYTPEQIAKYKAEWRQSVIRFTVESKIIKYIDMVKGEVSFDMSKVWDFVIQKSDWVPTFYLANAVDDYLMWVTNIIRAEEHLNNTPKQILLYEAFGWEIPHFWHLPLFLNQDKTKMSKRDSENTIVMVNAFMKEWYLPQALLNFVALLWWHPSDEREFFTKEELIKEFSIERLNNSNAVYDTKRALWFNSEYIRKLTDEEFVNTVRKYLHEYGDEEWKTILNITEKEYWLKLAWYIKVRLQTLWQFKDYAKYFFKKQMPTDEIMYNEKMWVNDKALKVVLNEIYNKFKEINEENWTEENIKNTILWYIWDKWMKNWQVLWPLRAVLTWAQASPWAFEMLYILWRKESLERISEYIELKWF